MKWFTSGDAFYKSTHLITPFIFQELGHSHRQLPMQKNDQESRLCGAVVGSDTVDPL